MDFLSSILSNLNIESQVYFKESFYKPWGMAIDDGPWAQFHMVVRGQCALDSLHLKQKQMLQAGDLVLCVNGAAHRLTDESAISCLSGLNVVETIKGGSNPFPGTRLGATLICGHFNWDREVTHPLLTSLPEILIVKAEDYFGDTIIPTVTQLIIKEQQRDRPGGPIVSESLAQLLFISIVRQYCLNQDQSKLQISDPTIQKALNLMHTNLEKGYTLEGLAKELAMSRTLFIDRFKAALDNTPMQYLTDWKMTLAKKLLRERAWPLSKVAQKIGYSSETSFQRAFRKYFGLTPGTYRKKIRDSLLV